MRVRQNDYLMATQWKSEIGTAIFRNAQKILKAEGVSTQVRARDGVLQYHLFAFGGRFRLVINDHNTVLMFTLTGRSFNKFEKTFPVIANPEFKPDDVTNFIVNVTRYLKGMRKLFE